MNKDDQGRKLSLVAKIMACAMFFNLIWYAFMNFAYAMPYPYSTFLWVPSLRFSDLADASLISTAANPYLFPPANYFPFTWVFLRVFAGMPDGLRAVLFLSICSGVLLVLLAKVLHPIVPKPWVCAFISLALIFLSYPVLYGIDRCNLELMVAALVAGALYFVGKGRPLFAVCCLVPAISFKAFPALLLVLIARRAPKWAIGGVLAVALLSAASLGVLSVSPATFLHFYGRNMAVFNAYNVYQNAMVDLSGSIWNAGKQVVLLAVHLTVLPPFDFNFDSPALHTAYAIYSVAMLALVSLVVLYAGLLEKEWKRGAIALLLLLSISVPSGGDYRLIYAGMAVILLVLTPSRRPADSIILVLLTLTQVPKKLLIVSFRDLTDSIDIYLSSEAMCDAVLIVAALFLLLSTSRAHLDLRWSRLRLHRLLPKFARPSLP